LQRFVYRQMMYHVILKSLFAGVRGGAVGWNKFERKGTAQMDGHPGGHTGHGMDSIPAVVEERTPTATA
jgi:hypothetical protein